MSTLSKVASFVLLLDQKLHTLYANVNQRGAKVAYKAADTTLAKNRTRAITLSANVSSTLAQRLASIDDNAARARIRALKGRDIELDRVATLFAQADEVHDKYISVGAVAYSAAAAADHHINKLADIRAGL